MFGCITGGPTDELHLFTKSSETGLGYSADSTDLLGGTRQVLICCLNRSITQLFSFNEIRRHGVERAFRLEFILMVKIYSTEIRMLPQSNLLILTR